MFRIGLSSKSNIFSEDLFSAYAAAGIDLIEVSNCTAGYDAIDFDAIEKMARGSGVALWSLHLPFKPYETFDISDKECAERAVEANKRLIDKGLRIGIKVFIIHPSGTGISPDEREERFATVAAALSCLADYAKERGAFIAVENMAHDCIGNSIDEFERLVNSHPALHVCFDVNHLLHEPHEEFVRRFGKKIITTHISDCDLENERHWMPGEGCLDFARILRALAEVGYEGPWLYEVSYKYPRTDEDDISIADFVEDAKGLFKRAAAK